MYSPKIKPDLVQKLYKLAKDRKIPMTALVNKIIEDYFKKNFEGTKEGLAVCEGDVNKYR